MYDVLVYKTKYGEVEKRLIKIVSFMDKQSMDEYLRYTVFINTGLITYEVYENGICTGGNTKLIRPTDEAFIKVC